MGWTLIAILHPIEKYYCLVSRRVVPRSLRLLALIPRHSGQSPSLAECAMVPARSVRPSVLSCPTPRCSLTTWPSPVSVVSTSPGLPRGARPVSPAIVGRRVLHERLSQDDPIERNSSACSGPSFDVGPRAASHRDTHRPGRTPGRRRSCPGRRGPAQAGLRGQRAGDLARGPDQGLAPEHDHRFGRAQRRGRVLPRQGDRDASPDGVSGEGVRCPAHEGLEWEIPGNRRGWICGRESRCA